MKTWFILLLFATGPFISNAQGDTIILTQQNINVKAIKPGINHYIVYFKNGKDSSRVNYQFWTRKIDFVNYNGTEQISVAQEWENNDTIFHKVTSICDHKTFAPLYQDTWWKSAGNFSFDFGKKSASVRSTPLLPTDTSAGRKRMWSAFLSATNQYVLNWHLDLEVFSMLPFKNNTTYGINFYDPGFSAPQVEYYTITGSSKLNTYDGGESDCWLLSHGTGNNIETFWISKKTREVLKLEQEHNGKYRYKIKLPFAL